MSDCIDVTIAFKSLCWLVEWAILDHSVSKTDEQNSQKNFSDFSDFLFGMILFFYRNQSGFYTEQIMLHIYNIWYIPPYDIFSVYCSDVLDMKILFCSNFENNCRLPIRKNALTPEIFENWRYKYGVLYDGNRYNSKSLLQNVGYKKIHVLASWIDLSQTSEQLFLLKITREKGLRDDEILKGDLHQVNRVS